MIQFCGYSTRIMARYIHVVSHAYFKQIRLAWAAARDLTYVVLDTWKIEDAHNRSEGHRSLVDGLAGISMLTYNGAQETCL